MATQEYLFVDEKQNIFTGDAAKEKLQSTSDVKFLSQQKGVIKINDERWNLAQSYERHYWMQRSISSNDDRNVDHYNEFEGYKSLHGKHFNHAIELGCGPFTNLRLIAAIAKIDECTLEDPLIDSYFNHPNCTYTDKKNLFVQDIRMDPIPVRAVRKLIRYFSPSLAGKITIRKNSKLAINSLVNLPIEELKLTGKYDLIVLINVIEHCKDIEKIFDILLQISKPGTMFVFSDKYYYHDKIENILKGHCFEAGHPLLIDRKVVESFLHDHFTPVFEKVTRKEHSINGFDWNYDSVYFIGKRK